MRVEKFNNYQNLNSSATRPVFGRLMTEHMSWGANYIKETHVTNFKLFTFPDVKAVFVEIANKTADLMGNINERLVNTLKTNNVKLNHSVVLPVDDETTIYQMESKGKGVFEVDGIPTKENSAYRYVIVNNAGEVHTVKDPYSKKQPNINGWSEIYNKDNYEWQNTDWLEGKDSRRITRKPDEKMRGLENLFIEEINIPTLSQEGTFDKAKIYIDKIAKDGVATAVEILPVENTYSLQWGYDGVDKFAVNEKLGGAVKLKELIDYAHGKGLNVIMDLVPNHVGPDGNYLRQTGPYIGKGGRFGDVPNYEGQNNEKVRDWMVNAALWTANEFKTDGIRFDMTKDCDSDWVLRQIVSELNYHNPNVFLIAEDASENRHSITTYSKFDNFTNEKEHAAYIDRIDEYVDDVTKGLGVTTNNIGFDSEWDFLFMHKFKSAIIQDNVDIDLLDEKLRNSHYRVKFVMSHDEIGNEDGTRLIPKVLVSRLGLFNKMNGIDDAEKGQRAAQFAQKLAELYANGRLEKMTNQQLNEYARKNNLNEYSYVKKDDIIQAFNIAIAKLKMSLATAWTVPGPKMSFQADYIADLSHFKFFRELSGEKYERENSNMAQNIFREKGYDTLETIARPDSIVGRVKYKKNLTQDVMLSFSKDLTTLIKNSKALLNGEIIDTFKNFDHKIHTHYLKDGDEEFLVIKNYGPNFHNNYGLDRFPDGKWEEVFNSDAKKYGGLDFVNKDRVITHDSQNISIAPNAIVILKKC